jgi:hypothetical protein
MAPHERIDADLVRIGTIGSHLPREVLAEVPQTIGHGARSGHRAMRAILGA